MLKKLLISSLVVLTSGKTFLALKENGKPFVLMPGFKEIANFGDNDLIVYKGEINDNSYISYSYYEEEQQFTTFGSWHLNRIVNYRKNTTNVYKNNYCNLNKNLVVNNYIVDTGIAENHYEFNYKKITNLYNAVGDNNPFDCDGHGTHVAGLIGSKSYGVCRDANIFAVKVLGCDGSGSTSNVIQGLQQVLSHHQTYKVDNKTTKGVINMSLGGPKSNVINSIVDYLITSDKNIYISVAAGNENNDACYTSPASSGSVMSVMASDISDTRAYFSNYGSCTDIYSPGVDIYSTYLNGKVVKLSGTSMAAPIVSGIFTAYVNSYPTLNMKELKTKITFMASAGVINKNIKNTPNLLVYLQNK